MRKAYVAGNWKMNLERRSALALCAELKKARGPGRGEGHERELRVAVAPPFVYLAEVAEALKGSSIWVGAQDVCERVSGAFTGEVSAAMLKDVGARFAIVGHSERRHVYGETDALINRRALAALAEGLGVILCVGETLAEREDGRTEKVVGAQLKNGLAGVDARALRSVTIAYEPVWAIGTGQNATPAQAGAVHSYLRGVLAGLYTESVAESVRIQYGGSVKPDNVKELMAVPEVDGCLVGGASLKPETFLPLLEFR